MPEVNFKIETVLPEHLLDAYFEIELQRKPQRLKVYPFHHDHYKLSAEDYDHITRNWQQ